MSHAASSFPSAATPWFEKIFGALSEPLSSWLNVNTHAAHLLITLLGSNALFSLLLAILIHVLLPRRLRTHPLRNVLAIAGLGSLLPVLGPLLLLIVGLVLPLLEKAPARLLPRLLPNPSYASEVASHLGHYGAGGVLARLRGLDNRQGARALMALEHRRNALTTRVINQTLGHPDETLRLLAYNLLERREKAIVTQLDRLDERLVGEPVDSARIALESVELHLEFIYLEIAHGSLRQAHLDAAARMLERIGEAPAEAAWRLRWLLQRARWMQLQGRAGDVPDIAGLCLAALEAGAAPARALPWLLEQAWKVRDHAAIRRLLGAYPLHPGIPLLGPATVRWTGVARS